jgi:hypothetical protein
VRRGRALAGYLLTLDAPGAIQEVEELFEIKRRKAEFWTGTTLFVVGIGLLAVVLWVLITKSPNAAG